MNRVRHVCSLVDMLYRRCASRLQACVAFLSCCALHTLGHTRNCAATHLSAIRVLMSPALPLIALPNGTRKPVARVQRGIRWKVRRFLSEATRLHDDCDCSWGRFRAFHEEFIQRVNSQLDVDFMTYEIPMLISFELQQWRVQFSWHYKIHYKDRQILVL